MSGDSSHEDNDWENPKWDGASRVHNWLNYISDELQSMWDTFTPAQKKAIFDNAEEQAMREEWD